MLLLFKIKIGLGCLAQYVWSCVEITLMWYMSLSVKIYHVTTYIVLGSKLKQLRSGCPLVRKEDFPLVTDSIT